ncbi:MAG: tryptophan synthase subunit alpha [Treponema sp.]|jgi:tryptophan synthase alpha chain|nr:tryptophan synthase subunit alpha [Treponema sp.]
MSNIGHAFKNGVAFIAFVTAGDPSIEKSAEFILELSHSGADIIEIGVPFSDPIAEGAVIQQANIRALKAGATIERVFGLAETVRRESTVPLVFLTYLNPVFHYGYRAFFERCERAGVDGVIIPDLPFEEHGEVRPIAADCGVDLISLIAPTSARRIKDIARAASGFLYIVSSLGVTGVRSEITTDLSALLGAVKAETSLPAAVGFGIHTPEQAADIVRFADGVIVGSALVCIIERHGENAAPHLAAYVKRMKSAIADAASPAKPAERGK